MLKITLTNEDRKLVEEYGHRKVRTLIKDEHEPVAVMIYALAAAQHKDEPHFTAEQWQGVLDYLNDTNVTLDQWVRGITQ